MKITYASMLNCYFLHFSMSRVLKPNVIVNVFYSLRVILFFVFFWNKRKMMPLELTMAKDTLLSLARGHTEPQKVFSKRGPLDSNILKLYKD